MDGWDKGVSGTAVHADRVVHVEHIWGTVITLNLSGTAGRERSSLDAIDHCRAFFAQIDARFSTYQALSEVTLCRAGIASPGRSSDDFNEVEHACKELRTLTLGAFDPWSVPGGYDPSGYVKGWAAGRASNLLADEGFADHLVNAGGDVAARGDETPGSDLGWTVGIINPHKPSEIIEAITLRDQAMATSGRYERGDHVIVPGTGSAATEVDSATVVGPDPGMADALATAAVVDGTRSMRWFATLGADWSLHLVMGQTVHTHGPAFTG